MPAEAPRRVINIRPNMTKESIYSTVPVELAPEGVTTLFCSTWSALNRPPSKNAQYWQDFLRSNLESRALHSSADSKNADVSIYWLPVRSSWQNDLQEELSQEELNQRRDVRNTGQVEHPLSGVGARIRKSRLDRNEQSALASAINEELGAEVVKIERGKPGAATVRVLLRFTDEEGNRESDEKIRNKLAVFTRQVMRATETRQFFSTSPAMRLLAMAVTERTREQSRALREAAYESQLMRRQMQRLHLSGDGDEYEDDSDLDSDGGEDEDEDGAVLQSRAA